MSLKANATTVENTGGQLKYLKSRSFTVYDRGLDEDFTDPERYTFECNRKKCSHIEIYNEGNAECMVGFDISSESMSIDDWQSYSFIIHPGKPFNYISLDGEADSISFKTKSGELTGIEIVVW